MSVFNDLASFAPVQKNIEHNGKTTALYFKEFSADDAEQIFDISKDDGTRDKAKAKGLDNRIVAASLCDEHGNPAITAEEVGKLAAKLRIKLVTAALEVNGLDAKKDASATTNETGTLSPES